MELVEIGRTGRPHGIKGELKLNLDEGYAADCANAGAVLIGEPAIPYFLEKTRQGGAFIVKLEGLDTREAVSLLANKPVFLPADKVSEVLEEGTPWDAALGMTIVAEGYPPLGPILDVMDLPEHYLAEVEHAGKTIYVPLHEDLLLEITETEIRMDLPEGLLSL